MAEPIPNPINLSRRRLCNPLGRDLGCTADCCAVSVARARAALTATFPRSSRSSARRASFGAAKSCSLVIFIIRPPTATDRQITPTIAAFSWPKALTRSLHMPFTVTPSHHHTYPLRSVEQPPVLVL